jgi:nitrogen fixation protein NifU and related proteins
VSSPAAAGPASLASMYQDVILSHYRQPHNKRELSAPSARVERKNPLCGDEIVVAVTVRDGTIVDAAFSGRCCSITQASASMLTDAVIGSSIADAELRWTEVDALLHGRPTADDASLGDRAALRGVAPFPARVACAMLPWVALRDALDEVSP